MSNYSSSDKTPANNAASPSETLYNNKNPIRFAPRGTQNSINDGIVVLDPRPVQQWQLDAASARAEGTANNLETRLDSTTTAQLELNSEIALLRYEVDGMFDLQKKDLEKARRFRNRALFFCVLSGCLWFLVCQRDVKEC
ncbi:uncharacterized protein BKA55DRAFT_311941 [Fusarium redolens]|uniref:Uncharacterized protein n=1 Tax=Fusarium redolens TaxID=48865 RepID=A0A9P9HCT5_FUSRE|nr:uncharacterized protein BKA55DRAFT_311941 [Fusarium redolens]KAH7255265.1 hypothetical protein BKA55DRAFT_311941 [Fusarium redolens]